VEVHATLAEGFVRSKVVSLMLIQDINPGKVPSAAWVASRRPWLPTRRRSRARKTLGSAPFSGVSGTSSAGKPRAQRCQINGPANAKSRRHQQLLIAPVPDDALESRNRRQPQIVRDPAKHDPVPGSPLLRQTELPNDAGDQQPK